MSVPGEPDSARHSSGHTCMLAAMTPHGAILLPNQAPAYFNNKHACRCLFMPLFALTL
jgi:hypothetical protein